VLSPAAGHRDTRRSHALWSRTGVRLFAR
jgi:hypothetical protein